MPAYAYIIQRTGAHGVCRSWRDMQDVMRQNGSVLVSRRFDDAAEAERRIAHAMRSYEGGPVAFVDGSARGRHTKAVGAGVSLHADGIGGRATFEAALRLDSPAACSEGQVSGELLAATIACNYAMAMGASRLTIAYDYIGIMAVAEGLYEARSKASRAWLACVDAARAAGLDVRFVHIYSHEGVSNAWEQGNDRADQLAKAGRDGMPVSR